MKTFKSLTKMQEKLDKVIVGEDVYSKDEVMEKMRLALLVEIGELANEVASFKYWKKSHKRDKEKILMEEADCMHFILSLVNFNNKEGAMDEIIEKFDITKLKAPTEKQELDDYFVSLYGECMEGNIGGVLHALVLTNRELGYTDKEFIDAYIVKNKINHDRVANKY